ncbi:PepSY domain-containing protein [Pseudomonadota bacterium]|nr:PepSY domain-containing protein [Pseudomonadota bacterium]
MNRKIRTLHRTVGAIIAVFVLMFAITGIFLNHTSDFELDKRYLTWNWLLEHYGVAHVEADVVYLLDQRAISQFGPQVFIDSTPVVNSPSPILGGVVIDDLMVLATQNELILFSHEGEFIEKMSESAGIPPLIQNIGLFHGEPVLQTRNGMWRSDFMLDKWEEISLQGIGWSESQAMPDNVERDLAEYFHGKGISIERFILDLHNGRILGDIGVWFTDIIGSLLMLISLSGLWMWVRRIA